MRNRLGKEKTDDTSQKKVLVHPLKLSIEKEKKTCSSRSLPREVSHTGGRKGA